MKNAAFLLQTGFGFIFVFSLLVGCGGPVTPAASPTPQPWTLVAVGDSIPYNKHPSCSDCTSFAKRYAAAIQEAANHPVMTQNLSDLGGVRVDDLLQVVKDNAYRRDALANADIVIVGIGFNDAPWLRDDDACDGSNTDHPDWSKYSASCAEAHAELFRPKFESLYSQIVSLREGKPTIFLTINRYNNWIGWPGGEVPPIAVEATRIVLDEWNEMVCQAAVNNGFKCADIYHAFNGPDGLTAPLDLLAKDYIHPSNKGHEVIAQVLEELGYAPLVP